MNVKLLKSEQEHAVALEHTDMLFDAVPGTPEGDEFELVLLVINACEDTRHPVSPPDSIEATRLTMEEKGIWASELTEQIGVSKGYVSQLLSRRKLLTASIMQALHQKLGISGDVLLG
jgi:HTH-type transcriptional regulator/antitoxin HigA